MRLCLRTIPCGVALFAWSTLCAGGVEAGLSLPPPSREIIASGDVVRGFGRIGYSSIRVDGIDGEGRVLFGAQLSDGRLGLFLADGRRVQELWRSSADGPRLQIDSAQISESGRVVAPTSLANSLSGFTEDLVEVRRDGLRRLLGPGDVTEDGDFVCHIGAFVMDRNGNIAVELWVGAAVDDCSTSGTSGTYLLQGETPRRIIESGPIPFDGGTSPIGMMDNGYVVVVSADRDTIIATDGIRAQDLVDIGGELIYEAAVNAGGDVVFLESDGERTRLRVAIDGAVRDIASSGGMSPVGGRILAFENLSIDGDGNVVVSHWSGANEDQPARGIVRYSADGTSTLVGRDLSEPRVNHAGQVAALRVERGHPTDVVRWSGGGFRQIVSGAGRAPGGEWYLAGGLGAACLSDDGLTGLAASTIDSIEGLLCIDAAGVHPVAPGIDDDAAPGFEYVGGCQFSQRGLIFIASEDSSTLSVYRADPAGVTRLIAAGDPLADGGYIQGLIFLGDSRSLATNSRGTIVVAVQTDEGRGLVLRREEDGLLEAVPIQTSASIGFATSFGVAADDTVVAIVNLPSGDTDADEAQGGEDGEGNSHSALVATDGVSSRILVRTGDPALPGGPFEYFSDVRVSEDYAWFTAFDSQSVRHLMQYDLARSSLSRIEMATDEEHSYSYIRAASAGGRILVETRNLDAAVAPIHHLVNANGDVTLVPASNHVIDPLPTAISDLGHMLLRSDQSPLGGNRSTVRLTGPEVTASCSQFGAQPVQDGGGCQVGRAADHAGLTMALTVPILLAARRMRRRIP